MPHRLIGLGIAAIIGGGYAFSGGHSTPAGLDPAGETKMAGKDNSAKIADGSAKHLNKGPGKGNLDDTRKVEELEKGTRYRIDSALRTRQGTGGDEDMIMKSQKGISNAPTMHSRDLMKDPEVQKKPEGLPASAKYPGTIDPKRPAR